MLTTENSQEPEDQGPSTQHEGVLYFGIFCTPLSYLISPPGTASAPDDEAPQTPIGAHQTLPDSPGAESFASPSFTSNSSLPRTPPSLAGRHHGSPRVGRHCESRRAQRQAKRKGAQDVNTFFKFDGGFKACIFCQFVTLCLIISFRLTLPLEKLMPLTPIMRLRAIASPQALPSSVNISVTVMQTRG